MYIFDLQSKLKRLNPGLYVKQDEVNTMPSGLVSSGIYLKNPQRDKDNVGSGKNLVVAEQRKYLEAKYSGHLDKFLMGVCLNYVPEYDIYDLERERILMPGWRTIAIRLAQMKVFSLDKAKKVFRCKSLGESDWDNMKFFDRIRWCKGAK